MNKKDCIDIWDLLFIYSGIVILFILTVLYISSVEKSLKKEINKPVRVIHEYHVVQNDTIYEVKTIVKE